MNILRGLCAAGGGWTNGVRGKGDERHDGSEKRWARGFFRVRWCVGMGLGLGGTVIRWVFGFPNGFIAACGFDFEYELSVEGCCNFEEHKIWLLYDHFICEYFGVGPSLFAENFNIVFIGEHFPLHEISGRVFGNTVIVIRPGPVRARACNFACYINVYLTVLPMNFCANRMHYWNNFLDFLAATMKRSGSAPGGHTKNHCALLIFPLN